MRTFNKCLLKLLSEEGFEHKNSINRNKQFIDLNKKGRLTNYETASL